LCFLCAKQIVLDAVGNAGRAMLDRMSTGSSGRSFDREQLVWDLLVAGWDREEIARRIGYASPARMSAVVEAAMRHRGLADAMEQKLALQLARLDRLQSRWWDAALDGDVAAATLVERIIEHRSLLLGLSSENDAAHAAER
jgi:hypothetical protein